MIPSYRLQYHFGAQDGDRPAHNIVHLVMNDELLPPLLHQLFNREFGNNLRRRVDALMISQGNNRVTGEDFF